MLQGNPASMTFIRLNFLIKPNASFQVKGNPTPGDQAKNLNLTQMKYFCEAKTFWLGLGLNF